jgi:hypothetical protein
MDPIIMSLTAEACYMYKLLARLPACRKVGPGFESWQQRQQTHEKINYDLLTNFSWQAGSGQPGLVQTE